MERIVYNDFIINRVIKHIDEAVNMSDSNNDPYFIIGYLKSALHNIKSDLEIKEDGIGKTVAVYDKELVSDRFYDLFRREPDQDEIDNVIKNYIGDKLDGIGEYDLIDKATEKIDDILYEYEREHMEAERDAV